MIESYDRLLNLIETCYNSFRHGPAGTPPAEIQEDPGTARPRYYYPPLSAWTKAPERSGLGETFWRVSNNRRARVARTPAAGTRRSHCWVRHLRTERVATPARRTPVRPDHS